MKRTTATTMKIIAIFISFAISQTSVPAQDGNPQRSLAGVWFVKITPRNCTTGEPIPTAAFETLFTFHKDGTMLVSFRKQHPCA